MFTQFLEVPQNSFSVRRVRRDSLFFDCITARACLILPQPPFSLFRIPQDRGRENAEEAQGKTEANGQGVCRNPSLVLGKI